MGVGRAALTAAAALVVGGCGGSTPSPALLHADAAAYLLTPDQLTAPGFTADVAAHHVTITELAAGDAATAAALHAGGLTAAATVDFFRDPGAFAEVNGPVQVRDTVEEFAGIAGATAVYAGDVRRLDAVAGSVVVSTGPLGDDAHATSRTAPLSSSSAVEITLEWRVGNVLDVLAVRGRAGGTRLDDALRLARAQTSTELGVRTTATPGVTVPAASASPTP